MMRRLAKRLGRYFDRKAVVLMYHRVAGLLLDPFELAVSADHFEEHLLILRKKFNVIKVNDLVNQLHAGALSANSVCITFDDGYADNYYNAKPLLEKYECPATFYIASSFMGRQRQFWWDELQYILLSTPQLPSKLAMHINGEMVETFLDNGGTLTKEDLDKHRTWLFVDPPPTQRCELFVRLWTLLKPLPFFALQSALAYLKSWSGIDHPFGEENFPMSEQQLDEIAHHQLFDLGVHTGTHPALSLYTRQQQYSEISDSKESLESKYGQRMQTISFPYGDYNDTTLSIVKQKQLRGAFTTREHLVTKRTSPVCIGRFQVKNWNGAGFENHLSQWFKKY